MDAKIAQEVDEQLARIAEKYQSHPDLRDRFAMAALNGIIGNILEQNDDASAARLTAKSAYLIADAMLAERQRKDRK